MKKAIGILLLAALAFRLIVLAFFIQNSFLNDLSLTFFVVAIIVLLVTVIIKLFNRVRK